MKPSGRKINSLKRVATKQIPSIEIAVTAAPEGFETQIIDAARAALESRRHLRGRLHIAVIGGVEMRRQHKRWMGDDTPTDVLTFDLRDEPEGGCVDGELLVCRTVARQRARGYDGDWRAELLLYVVHGCMHLCGLDDHDPAEAARMHRHEDRILKKLGWGEVFAAEARAARAKAERPPTEKGATNPMTPRRRRTKKKR